MNKFLSQNVYLDDYLCITPRLPENPKAVIDGQLAIGLWYNNFCAGFASVTDDLDLYYDAFYYSKLRKKLKGEWVIVQVQKSVFDLKNHNFRNLLVRHLVKAAEKSGVKKLYYMSSDKNYWMIPDVKDQLSSFLMPMPNEQTLKYNYDWTAKRNKFVYDYETEIFVRHL